MHGASKVRDDIEIRNAASCTPSLYSALHEFILSEKSRPEADPTRTPPLNHDEQAARLTSRLDAQSHPLAARISATIFRQYTVLKNITATSSGVRGL